MIENEKDKPKRKKKTSESDEKIVGKKTVSKRKTAEKKIELKDSGLTEEIKPAKKTRATRKNAAGSKEKITAIESVNPVTESPELSVESAENIQIVESVKVETVSEPQSKKRRLTSAKKAVDAIVSSPVKKNTAKATKAGTLESLPVVEAENKTQAEIETAATPKKEESPVFKELAEPKLPALPQENRARLQMQSPNRIFFYWSIKHNPFEILNRAFAGNRAANYTLTVKLVNLTSKKEELVPIEPAGSSWFEVDSNADYRAEVGFFAQNRPFVRLMYSNTVRTPRAAPSPNRDWSMDFAVTANQFAEVLDASGYAQDAFEVAITGDDAQTSDQATSDAFFQLVGRRHLEGEASELRSVLLALASQASLESLRGQISAGLFTQLEAITRENAEKLSAEKVLAALNANFALEGETEEFLTPVFGASSINFPRKSRFPKFSPISSLR